MVAAVRVHKPGGPEVLTFEDIEVPAPGPGQVKLKQHASGINYIDTYFRMGMYPSPVGMPFVAGWVAARPRSTLASAARLPMIAAGQN